jgi:hypothetical protein
MFFPSRPFSRMIAAAFSIRSIASGYSARM